MNLFKWIKLVTVEPAMFLQQAGDALTYVIFQNLFIDKICKIELDYSAGICDLYSTITSNDLKPEQEFLRPIMNEIQTTSSEFLLYNSLVENSIPVLLVLFLGVWSDRERRRKPPLLLCLVGKMLRSFGLLLNAYFSSWPPWLLLITASLPHSLGGANAVFHMASFSYIADASVPRSRTWRLGVAEIFWQLGAPVGLFLGAYLFELGGYLYVFGCSSGCHLVAVLYTAFILPEIPQPKPGQTLVYGKHGNYGTYTEVPKRIRYYSEHDIEENLHRKRNHNFKRGPSPIPEFHSEDHEDHLHGQEEQEGNNNAGGSKAAVVPIIVTEATSLLGKPEENTRITNNVKDKNGNGKYLTVPSLPKNQSNKDNLLDSISEDEDDDEEEDDEVIHTAAGSVQEFIIGSLRAIFKPRPNHTRKCLLSIGAIMLLYGISYYGEQNMRYLFTRNRFQWREQEFSRFTIFDSLFVVTGLVVVMPIFSKLFRFSDPFAGLLAALTRLSSRLCYALAPKSQYLYIGALIDIPGVIGPLSARSLASKCVLRDERGRVFAFLGCIEAIVPLIAVPIYSAIYSATLTFAPSTIYYLSTAIYCTIFIIFGVLFVALKMKIVQFSGNDLTSLLGPTETKKGAKADERASRIHAASSLYRRSSIS